MRKGDLRLADGINFRYGADEFQGAKLAPIRIRHSDYFGSQGPDGGDTCHLLIERGGRDLQSQPRSPGKVAPRGEDSPSTTDVKHRREIQKVLSLLVNPSGKDRNCKGKAFPSATFLGVLQFGHLETRIEPKITQHPHCQIQNSYGMAP